MVSDFNIFQSLYFKPPLIPACGNRNPSNAGALGNVGTNGNCRSSAPNTNASNWWDCYVLQLSSTAVNPANNNNWRGNGYAVRCVKEK